MKKILHKKEQRAKTKGIQSNIFLLTIKTEATLTGKHS